MRRKWRNNSWFLRRMVQHSPQEKAGNGLAQRRGGCRLGSGATEACARPRRLVSRGSSRTRWGEGIGGLQVLT